MLAASQWISATVGWPVVGGALLVVVLVLAVVWVAYEATGEIRRKRRIARREGGAEGVVMLKTILMAVVGFGLLWLALAAEIAAHECGDYLGGSRSEQEALCRQVKASITEDDVRIPRYGPPALEGTMPVKAPVRHPAAISASPALPPLTTGRVVAHTSSQGHLRCTGIPYWGAGCEEEMFAAAAADALRRAGGNECDLAYRRFSGMRPCSRYERAMQELE